MLKHVLLSIKPEFVEKIFDGTKCYEFRRVIFKNTQVSKVVIYASQPVQKVVGEFEIEDVLSCHPENLWEHTKDFSGIEREYFDDYFQDKPVGHAIKIKGAKRYARPLDLFESFNISRPPQSFQYLATR